MRLSTINTSQTLHQENQICGAQRYIYQYYTELFGYSSQNSDKHLFNFIQKYNLYLYIYIHMHLKILLIVGCEVIYAEVWWRGKLIIHTSFLLILYGCITVLLPFYNSFKLVLPQSDNYC